MSWSSCMSFLAFAAVLVVVPGADFTVVMRNTLSGGHHRGRWSAAGVTNPKVLVFYLAVLPQFVDPAAAFPVVLAFALSHATLSLAYLLVLVAGLHRFRRVLGRLRFRRALDAATGTVLLGFAGRLATERA